MAARQPKAIAWPSNGRFQTEVVGESYRLEALRKLLPARHGSHAIRLDCARLRHTPENVHDANAVAVIVKGDQIGFLSRDDSALYHRRFTPSQDAQETEADCLIEGSMLDSDDPRYSVWLDLDFAVPPHKEAWAKYKTAAVMKDYPPILVNAHGQVFMMVHWLPLRVIAGCIPGRAVDFWERPESDEVHLFCKGSIGGSGRIAVTDTATLRACGHDSLETFNPIVYAAGGRSVTILL